MHLGKVAVRKTVSALGLLGHGLVYSEVPLGVFVPTALGYEGVLLGRVGLVLAPCISFVVDELSSLNIVQQTAMRFCSVLLAWAADVLHCHLKVYAGLTQLLVGAMQVCETVMIPASGERRASTCDF